MASSELQDCAVCEARTSLKCPCGTYFCSQECQKLIWSTHKVLCSRPFDAFYLPPLDKAEIADLEKLKKWWPRKTQQCFLDDEKGSELLDELVKCWGVKEDWPGVLKYLTSASPPHPERPSDAHNRLYVNMWVRVRLWHYYRLEGDFPCGKAYYAWLRTSKAVATALPLFWANQPKSSPLYYSVWKALNGFFRQSLVTNTLSNNLWDPSMKERQKAGLVFLAKERTRKAVEALDVDAKVKRALHKELDREDELLAQELKERTGSRAL
ncbi:hypothetical protein JCM10213_004610 [Rhodosporidiobolus nylandii]